MPARSLPEKLSNAQRKQIYAVADDISAAALNTEPMDQAECREAIEHAYAYLELPTPELRFFESPIAAMAEMKKLAPSLSPTPATLLTLPAIMEELEATQGNQDNFWESLVFNEIASTQPRDLSHWGSEVDLPGNDLGREMLFLASAWQSGWDSFAGAVDKRVGRLIHYEHAVTDALEAIVDHQDQEWLLYSSGAMNIWRCADSLVQIRALVTLGVLDAAPPTLTLGRAVLESCGWINAFEKLCLICDRPKSLSQEGRPRDAEGLRTRVTWRDGQMCEQVWTD
jgi:hypothetical protein